MKRGFTLIELVLVCAIIGVMAISAIALIFNYKSSYIQIVSKKAVSDIDHARSLAMTNKGTVYGVFFDHTNNRYTVYQTAVGTPVADPQTKQSLIETFAKYSGVSVVANYTVEFNWLGSPTTGGGGSVQLTDGTTTKTISVAANTGLVTVQ